MRKSESWVTKHLNEERTMNNGQRAKIIGGEYKNLTVQFEDGTIVENKNYDKFKLGSILNPRAWINIHLNEERTMKNGQRARIIGGGSQQE